MKSMISKTCTRIAVGVAAALCMAAGANAQRSSGNISGEAVAGDTVVVEGSNTGFHREVTLKKDGKYRVSSVPTGEYVVTVKHADGTADAAKAVEVHSGVTVRLR
jgi:hypothetical protein